MKSVSIIGAGLTGSLLAIYLARRNYQVDLYEKRPDMRKNDVDNGRSINLAISVRGIEALKTVDLEKRLLKKAVPVTGRMMHSTSEELTFQAYGRNDKEYNLAISRAELNRDLLDATQDYSQITCHFNQKLVDVDLKTNTLVFEDEVASKQHQKQADVIFGADGAGSVLRQALSNTVGAKFNTEYLDHGYKELLIPAELGKQLELNCLHIWPRADFMLMALPNSDGSFTCTLFLALEGKESFASLKTEEDLMQFFTSYFPDAVPLMPGLKEDFFANPTGKLATVKGGPWYYQDKLMLLGDASHAIVPFLGQGMNAGFEDCRLFDIALSQHQGELGDMFASFYESRRIDADAIADMAVENYYEMRDHVGDPRFLLQKAIEQKIMHAYPERYVSKYAMISYSHEPYHKALKYGQAQAKLLNELSHGIEDVEELNDIALAKALAAYESMLVEA